MADTTTQTATTRSTPTVTALGQAVQARRSRGGASAEAVPSCSSRMHSTPWVSYAMSKSRRATAQLASSGSELLNFDGFVAPASFRGEDQPDAAGVILVLGRGGGVEQVNVFGDQKVAEGPSKRGGFAAGAVEPLAGGPGAALGGLLAVLAPDRR